MSDAEIGAYVTLGVWGLTFALGVRYLGLARTIWLVGILFFLAVRVMLGFVGAFRTDSRR